MDKKENRYSWLPLAMPGVARLMAEKRTKVGNAHVAECWRRSMAGEAGWFFAMEGCIAVGTPFDREAIDLYLQVPGGPRNALLILREPGVKT
jgi:hypothetical protein